MCERLQPKEQGEKISSFLENVEHKILIMSGKGGVWQKYSCYQSRC